MYRAMGNELDLGTVFAALQYYGIIRQPFSWLPRVIGSCVNIITSAGESNCCQGDTADFSGRITRLLIVSCVT